MGRAWDPAKHPRDSKGRFTRSRTTLLSDAEAARVRGEAATFHRKIFRSAGEQAAYLRTGPERPQEQRDAVRAYTGGQARDLNQSLRTKTTLPADQQATADQLRAAMVPTQDDIVLTRTVPLSAFGDAPIEQLAGKKVKDAGFTSASLGLAHDGRRDNVVIQVSVPTGTPALFAGDDSSHPGDREVILPDGMEFAVVSAVKNDRGGYDMHIVALPKSGASPGDGSGAYPVKDGRVELQSGEKIKVGETPSGKYEIVTVRKGVPIEGAMKTYATRDEALAAMPAAAAAYDARLAKPMKASPGAKTFEEQRAEKRAVADAAAAKQGEIFARQDAQEAALANLATDAQVNYALKLITARVRSGEDGGWMSFSGGYPTAAQLRKMTRKQISSLISGMKDSFS